MASLVHEWSPILRLSKETHEVQVLDRIYISNVLSLFHLSFRHLTKRFQAFIVQKTPT